jgi:condensin complex subunit 1
MRNNFDSWNQFINLHMQVGLRKMLHLIWTKDPSATSTGAAAPTNKTQPSAADDEPTSTELVKGIRSRLLECYRQLYFDPLEDPTMTAKDQISRIAKNMIEYVLQLKK